MPALRALHRAFPAHHRVLATPEPLTPLVRLGDLADDVLPTSGLSPLPCSGPSPDVAVNLHGRGPESHRLLQDLHPGRLIAFGCPEAGVAGPVWDQEEHEVRRWCRLLSESLGVPADPGDLRLPAPDVEPAVPQAVVVHPGAAYPSRRWPPDRFAAVARWAAGTGRTVVLTGSASERDLAEEVRRDAGLPSDAVLAGETDLIELAALVADAALVVCGDTGVAHVASAFGTPSVLLFGPTAPTRWGPPVDGPHTVLWRGRGDGDPWGEEVDPGLLSIEVEEVVAAAKVRLHSTGEHRRLKPVVELS